MATKKSSKHADSPLIAKNAKARHDYHVEDSVEAGMQLEGWEVKSLRQGRIQLKEGYVYVQNGQAYLSGVLISPLPTCCGTPDPTRTRKLLLHKKEIAWLTGATERKGYTLFPLRAYWKNNRAKLEVGLGKGKHLYDKRADKKRREWQVEQRRILKRG